MYVNMPNVMLLQVFSLPSLELMTDTTLSAAVGWQWLWDARAESRLEHVCACTRHGHLALLGKGSELVMLSLSVGTDMPQAAEYIYDWDLAAAAHAAGLAFEQARVLSGSSNMNTSNRLQRHSGSNTDLGGKVTKGLNNQDQGGGDAASVTALAASSSDGGTTAGAGSSGGRPKDFLGFMSKIGQDLNKAGEGVAKGFQKAIDETQKGLQKVAQVSCKEQHTVVTVHCMFTIGCMLQLCLHASSCTDCACTTRVVYMPPYGCNNHPPFDVDLLSSAQHIKNLL